MSIKQEKNTLITEADLEPHLEAIDKLVKGEGSWTEVIQSARQLIDWQLLKRDAEWHCDGLDTFCADRVAEARTIYDNGIIIPFDAK